MPHLTARVPEAQLAGREPALISALTDAVVEVYGPWARDIVVVHLDGVPKGRWGIGGRAAETPRRRSRSASARRPCRAPTASRSRRGSSPG
jgi:phenylpyruvate tautomerase PptA (4-oxalocrotonate tautomerase family)